MSAPACAGMPLIATRAASAISMQLARRKRMSSIPPTLLWSLKRGTCSTFWPIYAAAVIRKNKAVWTGCLHYITLNQPEPISAITSVSIGFKWPALVTQGWPAGAASVPSSPSLQGRSEVYLRGTIPRYRSPPAFELSVPGPSGCPLVDSGTVLPCTWKNRATVVLGALAESIWLYGYDLTLPTPGPRCATGTLQAFWVAEPAVDLLKVMLG